MEWRGRQKLGSNRATALSPSASGVKTATVKAEERINRIDIFPRPSLPLSSCSSVCRPDIAVWPLRIGDEVQNFNQ